MQERQDGHLGRSQHCTLRQERKNIVLNAIFDLLTKKGFYGYEYNELGEEAQKVYDSIYLNNP